jgi:hypothetical protein
MCHRLVLLTGLLALTFASIASAFDYTKYQPMDLDAILSWKRPASGVDLYSHTYRFDVRLVSAGQPCDARLLKTAMRMLGLPKNLVDDVPISQCIKVRSAKGRVVTLFIQDPVAEFLGKEVQPGGNLALFALLVSIDRDGVDILVNEFNAADDPHGRPPKPGETAGCECGAERFHPGLDYTTAEGSPVPVADDGVVVKIELDETAKDSPDAGSCGRYVVVRHSYANGRTVYTRYAYLGRIAGAGGKPIEVGMRVAKKDQIGEVGSRKLLHFEVRPVPVETGTGGTPPPEDDNTPMGWLRLAPVDPAKFSFETFGGKTAAKAP